MFSRGFKSMNVNFHIFPRQHNNHIWTSMNHPGQFWRLGWGTDSHFEHF
jgi:hypothetical protein